MSLPTRVSYRLPAEPEASWLEASRAPWALSRDRAAVLVHDMQHYFARPFAEECPAWQETVSNIGRILEAARAGGVPVAYTAQPGDQESGERGLLGDLWGPGISADEKDTAIIASVAPVAGEPVIPKLRYSAFAGHSAMADWLAETGRDQLVIVGIYAHIGVAATATEAFMRDIQPFVISDAVADFSSADHERALVQIARCCGVVMGTGEVLATLNGKPAGGWSAWLAAQLDELMGAGTGAAMVARPEDDLFHAGFDSVRAFALLDSLADHGVVVDFTDFVANANAGFLLAQIEIAGVEAP